MVGVTGMNNVVFEYLIFIANAFAAVREIV